MKEPDLYITSIVSRFITAYIESGATKFLKPLANIKLTSDWKSGNVAVYGIKEDVFMDNFARILKSLKRRGLAKELFEESRPKCYED